MAQTNSRDMFTAQERVDAHNEAEEAYRNARPQRELLHALERMVRLFNANGEFHRGNSVDRPSTAVAHARSIIARIRFQELAAWWEAKTVFISNSQRARFHPAHEAIVNLGQPVVPFILERMRAQGGHWFEALEQITGENPVPIGSHGNIEAMQRAWLQWGEEHGHFGG